MDTLLTSHLSVCVPRGPTSLYPAPALKWHHTLLISYLHYTIVVIII